MSNKNNHTIRDFLDAKVLEYNDFSFIENDPVSVPHRFNKKQDIEISGFFAAVFAWGIRKTIIQKSNELMKGMDDSPHDFILHHQPRDLKKLLGFRHRTFNATDLLYFIRFLKFHYQDSDSLESAFFSQDPKHKKSGKPADTFLTARRSLQDAVVEENEFVKNALSVFYDRFFVLEDSPRRTRKHIASPEKNSTCKRLNMYLRWMVRKDAKGVDFGIWKNISSSDLICPVDLHVARVARKLGLIQRSQTDWDTAMELTRALRLMDKKDPVKYDFALFGLGVSEKY